MDPVYKHKYTWNNMTIALFYFKVISVDFNKFYIFLKLAQNSYKTRAEELY
jgi:hypothetical protein